MGRAQHPNCEISYLLLSQAALFLVGPLNPADREVRGSMGVAFVALPKGANKPGSAPMSSGTWAITSLPEFRALASMWGC